MHVLGVRLGAEVDGLALLDQLLHGLGRRVLGVTAMHLVGTSSGLGSLLALVRAGRHRAHGETDLAISLPVLVHVHGLSLAVAEVLDERGFAGGRLIFLRAGRG